MKTYQSARFRPDMADFVLRLKRRRVMEALVSVTHKYRGYISMYIPTKSLKTCQVAAVLLLGPTIVDLEKRIAVEEGCGEAKPKKLQHVPVFDLKTLLGETMLKELVSTDATRWNSELLTIKSRNYCKILLQRLWELEGYITPLLK